MYLLPDLDMLLLASRFSLLDRIDPPALAGLCCPHIISHPHCRKMAPISFCEEVSIGYARERRHVTSFPLPTYCISLSMRSQEEEDDKPLEQGVASLACQPWMEYLPGRIGPVCTRAACESSCMLPSRSDTADRESLPTPSLSLGLSQGYSTHISRVVLPDCPTPDTSLHLTLSTDHTDAYERTV